MPQEAQIRIFLHLFWAWLVTDATIGLLCRCTPTFDPGAPFIQRIAWPILAMVTAPPIAFFLPAIFTIMREFAEAADHQVQRPVRQRPKSSNGQARKHR